MFTRPLNCGHCGHLVDFHFGTIVDYRHLNPSELQQIGDPGYKNSQQGASVVTVKAQDQVTAAAFTQCPRCNFPTMVLFKTTHETLVGLKRLSERGSGATVTTPVFGIVEQYPQINEPDTDPRWPDSIRRKFSDAQRMQQQQMSPSIILTTCGTVLELAMKALDQSDSRTSLFKRIENLHTAGVITSPIKDWAHDIRLDRNDAVHDGEGDENDAVEYIEFLKMFFNMAFSLPNRIKEKRALADTDS